MRGNYYEVLGVSPSATETEIKARYRRLIQRYHPDRNHSPLAHARTAEINEAFHFLSDPDLRSWHDAQLAARRQDVLTARALVLSRGGGRALVVRRRRRRPLLQRYGARLALAGLLVGTGVAGWQIEQHLLGSDDAFAALAGDSTDSKAHRAVEALEAASAREAQDMPPVSSVVVANGVGAYRRVAASGDLAQARAFSERCLAQAADADGWDALDFCVAFDQAAFVGIDKTVAPAVQNAGYFIDRHDRATHLYVSRLSSLDTIDQRLDRIRALVGGRPEPRLGGTARVLHSISKHGWMLAGAAWHVFNGPDVKHDGADPHARDF